MRKALFGLLALLGGAEAASAQAPAYGYPAYYQGAGYPQQAMPGYGSPGYGYGAPAMPTQYPAPTAPRVYYGAGYYQGGAQPSQYYNNYPNSPNSYYNNGAPAPYYQPQAPTYIYTPAARQMYTPMPAAKASSWPIPVSRSNASQAIDPDNLDIDNGLMSDKKPIANFHRPTKDLFWVDASYTAAFFRPMQVPTALVTTGSQNDAAPGAPGQPSTATLYGNQNVNFNLFSGMRLEAGLWLDTDNRFSIELNGFWYFPNYSNFTAAADGNGNPVLARPINNVATGAPGAFLNSLPGTLNGTIHIDSKSEIFGTEFNARAHGYFGAGWHVDGLFGFRYLRLAERMNFTEQINPLVGGFASFQGATFGPPNSLRDFDGFQTYNQFFGPQVGARASYEYKWFTMDGFFKLALGGTVQQTTIAGSTTLVTPTGNISAPGGILAVPSNIGNYSRTVFGIVPEFGFNLGVDLCQNVRLKLGYSLLMWNHVVRPGNQLNPNVNPGQVPGSPAAVFANVAGPMGPTYRFNDEFFWGHAFNLGVEVHY